MWEGHARAAAAVFVRPYWAAPLTKALIEHDHANWSNNLETADTDKGQTSVGSSVRQVKWRESGLSVSLRKVIDWKLELAGKAFICEGGELFLPSILSALKIDRP